QITTAQQNEILSFMPMFRSNMSTLAIGLRVLSQYLTLWNNGGLSTVVNLLAAGTVIPDTTGLAGAQPLTSTDVVNTMTVAQNLITAYYTSPNLTEFIKIAGPPNV